jgi:nucleotidyltransferase/DNA polymerase involved in DNA repair
LSLPGADCNQLVFQKHTMSYYDDLSAESSKDNSSSSDDDESDQEKHDSAPMHNSNLWNRSILHLDIDCFYCQCEEIDRNLRSDMQIPPRPLAIGQKHIIVTCNYEARKYGVTKLQLRETALAACPDLWIVEGSDLQHYRRHSRAVYEAFRRAVGEIASELFDSTILKESSSLLSSKSIPARKGTMDEMMADLTLAVQRLMEQEQDGTAYEVDPEQSLYSFGETAPSSVAVLVEDQTGQETIVSFQKEGGSDRLPESRRNVHDTFDGTDQDRQACIRRLAIASKLTARICKYIRDATGFHTTGGISVSPLLAKLASDLNKPKSVNLLYPWRSSRLFYSMPLRKMQNVGSRTMKALETSMPGSSSPIKGTEETRTVR